MFRKTMIITASLCVLAGCAQKEPEPMTEEQISEMIAEVDAQQDEMLNSVTGEINLVGSWTAENDSSVTMSIIESEKDVYEITVMKNQNDTTSDLWTMHGSYDPVSGMLEYKDGVHTADPYGDAKTDADASSGTFLKQSADTLMWMDSALDIAYTFRKDANSGIPYMQFAEGPFVLNNTFSASVTAEETERFEKALDMQIGAGYKPIAVLASQVVNGTNYAYLAYAEYTLNKFTESYAIVIVNQNSAGELSLVSTNPIDVNAVHTKEADDANLLSSWQISEIKNGTGTADGDQAFKEAADADETIKSLSAVALLGTDKRDAETHLRFLAAGKYGASSNTQLYIVDTVKRGSDPAIVEMVSGFDLPAYTE